MRESRGLKQIEHKKEIVLGGDGATVGNFDLKSNRQDEKKMKMKNNPKNKFHF